MKAEVKIPKGFRRLRAGEVIREGDFLLSGDEWLPFGQINWGYRIGVGDPSIRIRRINRPSAVKKGRKG